MNDGGKYPGRQQHRAKTVLDGEKVMALLGYNACMGEEQIRRTWNGYASARLRFVCYCLWVEVIAAFVIFVVIKLFS